MPRKRIFIDASSDLRCHATVTLRDKTTAQCGRYFVRDYAANPAVNAYLCEQHATMKLQGKTIVLWK